MEQQSAQHHVFIVETFFKNGYCCISVFLITEKFLATIPYSYGMAVGVNH
jgi:hypothetical protein